MKSANPKQTWKSLSEAMEFSTTAIRKWRQLPGAPTDPDPDQWQQFINANDLGIGGNRIGGVRGGLLIRKLEMEILLLELRIEKQRANLITAEEHNEYMSRLATNIRSALHTIENVVPRLTGKTPAEMRRELRNEADRYIRMFAKTMDKWDVAK